ncbi:MAG: hypothetical protein LBC99_08260 [Spirochaetota bacterium]|jgi:hypothetical protein|nr:hypothetical protein [Spirochaetota bacterium]
MAALSRRLIIIFILILGCGVYMVLSAPLAVEPGHIALVQSDLFGIGNTVYASSGINWVWTRLIPGDSRAYSFPEGESAVHSEQRFLLPPGEVPGIGNTDDFLCALNLSIRWRITRASLPPLVQSGVTNEDALAVRAFGMVVPILRNALVNETEQALLANRALALPRAIDAAMQNEAAPALQSYLSNQGVALTQFNAYWITLPDPARYARARAAVAEADLLMTERIREWYRANAELNRKARESEQEAKTLAVMAKLITDYPKMLDYFMIAKLSGKIRLAVLPANGISVSALKDIMKEMRDSMQTNRAPNMMTNNAENKAAP